MPTPYNGSQSPLEYYAINGNTLYPGSGRLAIIGQTKIGNTKYAFQGPYKNPQITGNVGSQYGVTHTNALHDNTSPFNGRGTGSGVVNGVYAAIENYNGGNVEDINGAAGVLGSGRNPQLTLNSGLWGYGPGPLPGPGIGAKYVAPNMAGNVGQVVI